MLTHIALTINDTTDIENLYENILLFNKKYSFTIDKEITHHIFSENNAVDVQMMECNGSLFEMFIAPHKEIKTFSHVCLSYKQAELIYKQASGSGYKTVVRRKEDNTNIYFLWDKSGNMFEIKELY